MIFFALNAFRPPHRTWLILAHKHNQMSNKHVRGVLLKSLSSFFFFFFILFWIIVYFWSPGFSLFSLFFSLFLPLRSLYFFFLFYFILVVVQILGFVIFLNLLLLYELWYVLPALHEWTLPSSHFIRGQLKPTSTTPFSVSGNASPPNTFFPVYIYNIKQFIMAGFICLQ